MRGGAHAQAAGVDFARPELVQLGDQQPRVDGDARADNAQRARVEDARWDQVDGEATLLVDDSVPGIRPAVPTDNQISIARQQIDDLALAFVAPMAPNNSGYRHGLNSSRRHCNPPAEPIWGGVSLARKASAGDPLGE